MQSLTGSMITAQAIAAGVARNMMGHKYPVTDFIILNTFACLYNLSCNLMSQNPRSFFNSVPFHNIASADAARHDLNKKLALPCLWNRHLFNPYVIILLIHRNAHKNSSHNPLSHAKRDYQIIVIQIYRYG